MRVFLVVFAAQTLFLWVYGISDNFSSLGDFFKTLKDKEYNYLSYVFRKGKHLRFISDFPADLRKACLGKKSFYLETEKDLKPTNKKRQEAKRLVRAVLTNDDLINEYFKGTYFTYEDYDNCNFGSPDICPYFIFEVEKILSVKAYEQPAPEPF